MISYHEALSRCLEAVAEGRDLDTVIAGLPGRHRDRLRRDATLTDALRRHAATIPAPSGNAEINALSRLNAELNSVRASRQASASRGGFFGLPRFALAGLLLAALLLGASFIIGPNRDGNGTVEAAEFEGVVVANSDGSLTVQTLDTLEEVTVPLNAIVLDENGAAVDLHAIEAGEVIKVQGNRAKGGPVNALNVRRVIDGLPGWCDENAERCRKVAQLLKEAQARCDRNPEACPQIRDHIKDVIASVTDVTNLEELKQHCRNAGGDVCSDITSFCRDHPNVCAHNLPPGPVVDRLEDARQRLEQLNKLCNDRDTSACRQIAQVCAQHPDLCTNPPSLPPRAPLTDGPTATPASDAQPTIRAGAEDTRPTDSEPTGPASNEPPPGDSPSAGDRGSH